MDYNQALEFLSSVEFEGEDLKNAQDMQEALASGAGEDPAFQQMVIEFATQMQAKAEEVAPESQGAQFVDANGNPIDEKQYKLLTEQMQAQSGDPEELAKAWSSFKGIPLDEAKKVVGAMPNRVRAEIMGKGEVNAIEGGVASTADILSRLGSGAVASIDALTGNEDFLTSLARVRAKDGSGISGVAENIARDPLSILGFGTASLGNQLARGGSKALLGSAEPITRLGRFLQGGTGASIGGGLDIGFEQTRRGATGEQSLSGGEMAGMTALPFLLTGTAGARSINALDPTQASAGFGKAQEVMPQGRSVEMPTNLNPKTMKEQGQIFNQMVEASTPQGFTPEQIDLLPETTRLIPELAKNDPMAMQKVNEYAQEVLKSQKDPNVTFGRKINAHLADAVGMLDAKRQQVGADMAGIEKMASANGLTLFPKSKMIDELNKSLQDSPFNLSIVKDGDSYKIKQTDIGNLENPTEIVKLTDFIANLPPAITGESMRNLERQINGLIADRAVSRASQGLTTDERTIVDFKKKIREAVFESIEGQLGEDALKQYKKLRSQYGEIAETKDELERRIGREVDEDYFARGLGFLSGSLKNESDRGARGLLKSIKSITNKDLQKEIAYFEAGKKMAGSEIGTTMRDLLKNRNASGIVDRGLDFLTGTPDPKTAIESAIFQAQGGSYARSPMDWLSSLLVGGSRATNPIVSNPAFIPQGEQQ